MPGPVIIFDYDPSWPKLYEKEKSIILKAVGHRILAIEHIGSTAVPGLGAKNIVDMIGGVNGLGEANECLAFLDKIGYSEVTPEPDNPEWYYCVGKHSAKIGYHLHLVQFNSDHWRRHLLFRDFLRNNPEVAKEYCDLKKKLAAKYETDREGYTEAKTAFITSVLAKANTRYVNK